jgi:large subunit ribosomal protein L7A
MLQYAGISGEVCPEGVMSMSKEILGTTAAKVVGLKQTTRALMKGTAKEVFVAEDADEHLTTSLIAVCAEKNVTCTKVATMQELGKACGIHAGAAAAAILKD